MSVTDNFDEKLAQIYRQPHLDISYHVGSAWQTLALEHSYSGAIDADTLIIIDAMPAELSLKQAQSM